MSHEFIYKKIGINAFMINLSKVRFNMYVHTHGENPHEALR